MEKSKATLCEYTQQHYNEFDKGSNMRTQAHVRHDAKLVWLICGTPTRQTTRVLQVTQDGRVCIKRTQQVHAENTPNIKINSRIQTIS